MRTFQKCFDKSISDTPISARTPTCDGWLGRSPSLAILETWFAKTTNPIAAAVREGENRKIVHLGLGDRHRRRRRTQPGNNNRRDAARTSLMLIKTDCSHKAKYLGGSSSLANGASFHFGGRTDQEIGRLSDARRVRTARPRHDRGAHPRARADLQLARSLALHRARPRRRCRGLYRRLGP